MIATPQQNRLDRAINFLSGLDMAALRLSVILIFALFGTYKWFSFEINSLKPLLSVTWLQVLYTLFGIKGGSYFLGVMENITFIALFIGFFRPAIGAAGSVLVIITGLTTLSLLPQLGKIDSFIIKDILLIGAGLVLLRHDLVRLKKRSIGNRN